MLSETVVVGYSTQKRNSLTGSLQSIDNKELTNITTANVTNMLTGKVPGMNVMPGSGKPGSFGAIIVRGKSTINGSTAPLWVIDGVIVGKDPGDINPNDIETLTVLKDAASTAIYGRRVPTVSSLLQPKEQSLVRLLLPSLPRWAFQL